MGVPTYYHWCTTRFPKCVRDAIEPSGENEEEGNLNGDYDNLYLDMNGILHPCCRHEKNQGSEELMFGAIFEYIDRIITITKPKNLVYLAIDGVAPRAKMNQQRARRYCTAKEREDAELEEVQLRQQFIAEGRAVPEKKNQTFDPNVLTPGTPFMHKVGKALAWYIHDRYTNNELWKELGFRVILSDSNSPGEGEHKIMEYIRSQRAHPDYNPNTKHIVYGADADFILLGLATHEPHFSILREVAIIGKEEKKCSLCGRCGHVASECNGDELSEGDEGVEVKPFQIMYLSVLREYLDHFFKVVEKNITFKYDFENFIDDYVFLSFFVGNDFLPHLPALSIRDGALDLLLEMYINLLPLLGGYLTSNGMVNLNQVDMFLEHLGLIEDDLFRNKKQLQDCRDSNLRHKLNDARTNISLAVTGADVFKGTTDFDVEKSMTDIMNFEFDFNFDDDITKEENDKRETKENDKKETKEEQKKEEKMETFEMQGDFEQKTESGKIAKKEEMLFKMEKKEDVHSKAEVLKQDKEEQFTDAMSDDENEFYKSFSILPNAKRAKTESNCGTYITKDEIQEFNDRLAERIRAKQEIKHPTDNINLGEDAPTHWKKRYYFIKFNIDQANLIKFLQAIKKSYITGLCWIMEYYYHGVPSWNWFYDYHYAPLASDLSGCSMLKIKFDKGQPFMPFEQLMSVLPPSSARNAGIPEKMVNLMMDKDSPIIEFYPKDFDLDLNGKRFKWQAVVLLPFIDEEKLLANIQPLMAFATNEEKERSAHGRVYLFGCDEDLRKIGDITQKKYEEDNDVGEILQDFQFGKVYGFELGGNNRCIPSLGSAIDVEKSDAVACVYTHPKLTEHICKTLPGVLFPDSVIQEKDLSDLKIRKGYGGDQAKKIVYTHLGHLFGDNSLKDRYRLSNKKKYDRDNRVRTERARGGRKRKLYSY